MHGFTLLELLTVLVFLGVGVSAMVPTSRRLADRATVAGARETLIAALLEARQAAIATGEAAAIVVADPPQVRVDVAGRSRPAVTLPRGVSLRIGAGRDSSRIRFDALGVGRFANETVEILAGDASAGVVVSSYGRVRRR